MSPGEPGPAWGPGRGPPGARPLAPRPARRALGLAAPGGPRGQGPGRALAPTLFCLITNLS